MQVSRGMNQKQIILTQSWYFRGIKKLLVTKRSIAVADAFSLNNFAIM